MSNVKQLTVIESIIDLWRYLAKKNRGSLIFLFVLMIISGFFEIVSLGAIVPFLSALTAPENLMELTWFQPVITMLGIKSADELLFPLTLGFILITVLATGVRVLLLWTNTRLTAHMGIELKSEVYAKALNQPYEFHIAQNSSELISLVTEKIAVAIGSGVNHVLMLLTSLFTGIAIVTTLLLVQPIVAILAFFILSGGYLLIGYLTRKQIKYNGDIIAENQPIAVKYTQEGLGGIRDIIIGNSQNVYIELYANVTRTIQSAMMKNSFLSLLPKSLLEMMGIVVIASFAYYLQTHGTSQLDALPILGVLALGAQRLLPVLQQIYFSWANINGSHKIIEDVLHYLNQPMPLKTQDSVSHTAIKFNNDIQLNNISFKYQNSEKYVLEKINLKITKGSRIGFIGETGSGKSTLLDIIMGLLVPIEGKLLVDGVSITKENIVDWQKNIAHVPQSIFLSDASLAENIAFGIPTDEIDMTKIKKAAHQASIDTFIEALPEGYKTTVGERGVQLSGGQRQRIGIARALYKQANVIVFDEATSALDEATERNVMQAIDLLDENLTILIIAHRLTTLSKCDLIYKMDKGSIIKSGTYEQIINKISLND